MKSISPVLVSAIALFASCGGGNVSQDTGSGSGGAPGTGGQTTGSGGSGSGGTAPGTGGSPVGSGGTQVDAPSVDATPEASVEVAADVSAGGFKKQFSCPDGQVPAGTVGPQMAVCAGFRFNFGYHEGPTWIAS